MKGKGKHPHNVLTSVKVRQIKAPGRYADGNGLYPIVDPSGARRWVLRTVVQGRRRDIGLGGAQLVSLAEARDKAQQYRKMARDGGDPLAEMRKNRTPAPTFAEAARAVHAEHVQTWENKKHRAQWINTLIEYVVPLIGDRRVDAISSPDVLGVLAPIGAHKQTDRFVPSFRAPHVGHAATTRLGFATVREIAAIGTAACDRSRASSPI